MAMLRCGVAACVAASLVGAADVTEEIEVLPVDDECLAAETEEERQSCAVSAIQLRGQRLQANKTETTGCGSLYTPQNNDCRSKVEWASSGGGKYDGHASNWFKDMQTVAGVDYLQATKEDFQRLYFCAPPGGNACGTPPCTCSKPPCDQCLANQRSASEFKACRDNPGSIACKPPRSPMDYKGMSWPTIKVTGTGPSHLFAIGDWGGLDGTLNPAEGRPNLVAYRSGSKPGPSVCPRTRWNIHHTVELCNHKEFLACYDTFGSGPDCPASCGYTPGVDDQPQILVANAMRARAATGNPGAILNVGDNFYWGGIEKTCGTTPMNQISFTAKHQFDQIFENVYQGQGLSDVPWLSVLGNHDWGGRQFNNGWDQQIAYTWASERWVMPAPYFMTTIDFVDQGFTMDVFLVDTNVHDALMPMLDPEHNICGFKHNPTGANCYSVGGPMSYISCPSWFQQLWQEQKVWLMQKLSASQADWQVMVTHFPCGQDGENQRFYRKLHQQYGLDLLVTGHRHDQELWLPSMGKNQMGGLTCFVTGGGGGISSEATPNPNNKKDWYGEGQYGFYDLTVTKSSLRIESINYDGKVLMEATVYPK